MTNELTGKYVRNQCCQGCDYYDFPLLHSNYPPAPRLICPNCGDTLKVIVGRFKYKIVNYGLFNLFERTEITGFIRRKV